MHFMLDMCWIMCGYFDAITLMACDLIKLNSIASLYEAEMVYLWNTKRNFNSNDSNQTFCYALW